MSLPLVVIGAAFMIPFFLSSALLVRNRRRLAGWSRTSATITDVWTTSAQMGTGGHLTTTWIRYAYAAPAGRSHSDTASSPGSHPMTGKTVEVRHDPASPGTSQTTEEQRRYLMPVGLFFVMWVPGGLMIAYGAGLDVAEYLLATYIGVLLMAPLVIIAVVAFMKRTSLRPARWIRAAAVIGPYDEAESFLRAGKEVDEPCVAYRYVDTDGTEHTGYTRRPTLDSRWGDDIEVEYDAADPARSRPVRDRLERVVVGVTLGAVFAAVFGAGVWLVLVAPRELL